MEDQSIQHGNRFVVSTADMKQQATVAGWRFWRGIAIGFFAGFVICYAAAMGQLLPGVTL